MVLLDTLYGTLWKYIIFLEISQLEIPLPSKCHCTHVQINDALNFTTWQKVGSYTHMHTSIQMGSFNFMKVHVMILTSSHHPIVTIHINLFEVKFTMARNTDVHVVTNFQQRSSHIHVRTCNAITRSECLNADTAQA